MKLKDMMRSRASNRIPEESTLLRGVIGMAVMTSVAAVIAQDVVAAPVGLVVLVLIPFGFWVAWKRRRVNQVGLKIAVAGLLVLAFANFLRQISGAQSIDDARAPLAEIFLWVQTLHSFDQPRRTDLRFSLAASAALIALGGSLSVDASFLLFFVPWGMFAMASLSLSHLSEVREKNDEASKPRAAKARGSFAWRPAAAVKTLVTIGASVVFLFAPRGRGMQLQSLPFEIKNLLPLPEGSSGIVNRGLPSESDPGADPAEVTGNTYFGFANSVDMRVRGLPSDEIVMRVRASQPAFWRGPAFDTYKNSSWTTSNENTSKLSGLPVDVPGELDVPAGRPVELVQTFYVEKAQSNIVFAAYHPRELWFPGGRLEITDERGVRAGFILDEGLVYSAVSEIPSFSREKLEVTTSGIPQQVIKRYTQTPTELPGRVRGLAKRIAGDEPTIIGKTEAIEKWLKENTEYLLEIPPQPRGTDAIDHFLFEEKRGFCEHFAASMAIMLRTLGVPTRFATGYDAGDRNVFSGYWEVRARHAHSWVEVYFPEVGWVQFDPTAEVPRANPGPQTTVPGIAMLRKGAAAVSRLIPDGAGPAVGRALKTAMSAAFSRGPVVAALLVAAAAVFVLGRILIGTLSRRRRISALRCAIKAPPNEFAAHVFWLIDRAGAEAGMPRPPASTPSEYGEKLLGLWPELNRAEVSMIIETVEAGLYGGKTIEAHEAEPVGAAAVRIGETLVAATKPPQ